MPVIEPVNTQQILQMSPHAEKLQQASQNQPALTSQQLTKERIDLNELKRTEVQDPEHGDPSEPTNPEGKRRGRLRRRSKAQEEGETRSGHEPTTAVTEMPRGKKIDVVI